MTAAYAVVLIVMFATFVWSASCCSATQAQTSTDVLTCGVGVKGETKPVRSNAGFTVVVTMSADDDHSKNSHKCAAIYTLKITRPDGSSISPYRFLYSDDEWDRPLTFRVEGFSKNGNNVFVLLLEGNHPQSLQAEEFEVNSGHNVKSVLLNTPFTQRLSENCAATLHLIGTSPEGYLVLGTEAKDGCTKVERWQLTHNKHVVRGGLPAELSNDHPKRLPPHATITNLEPGIPVDTR